jgi:spore coat protein U-like protein
MNARIASIAAVVLAYALAIAPARAGDAATVRVTANVLGVCKVVSVEDIGFGDLDPSRPVDAQARGVVRFMCTRGVDYRLAVDQGRHYDAALGQRRMRGADGALLPYALAQDGFSGIGTGFRTPIELPLAATIRGDDYRDLPASAYEDVIRVVLEP